MSFPHSHARRPLRRPDKVFYPSAPSQTSLLISAGLDWTATVTKM
jgi:hypothetical protein